MAAIHKAALGGKAEKLRRLLESGESPDTVYNQHAFYVTKTPLHCLCQRNNGGDRAACFELLREAGANLEARTGGDPEASTVLHFAAKGRTEILSLLLEAGLNVNVTNSGGYTPLHWAAGGFAGVRRSTECVELLLKAAPP